MRIVILGGSGMIGHKLLEVLSKRFESVYALIHRDKGELKKYGIFSGSNVIDNVDVTDFKFLEGILHALRPTVIINCIGITKRNPEAINLSSCLILNSLLSHRLSGWGLKHNARVIVFSTDCIFDGKLGKYTEKSLPSAEDTYGRTKYLGEIYGSNCLTLRTSFIGREISSFTELLEWLIAQNGKSIRGYQNAFYTGVSTLFLSKVVVEILENYPTLFGLYHLSGEVISKYDLLCLARDAFKLNIEIVKDKSFSCYRTLVGDKFREATGITIPPWSVMMPEIALDTDLYLKRGLPNYMK